LLADLVLCHAQGAVDSSATIVHAAIAAAALVLVNVDKSDLLIETHHSAEATATPVSRLFVLWLLPLQRRSYVRTLTQRDIPACDPDHHPSVTYARFEMQWADSERTGRTLFWTILATFRHEMLQPVLPGVLAACIMAIQPYLLYSLVSFAGYAPPLK
jgi:hypothetical protein